MDKLIFERYNNAGVQVFSEPSRIIFELAPSLTVSEFKTSCKRLAQAMGYSNDSVIKEFGADTEVGDPAQLKMLLG